MATLEELVVSLTAETQGLRTELNKATQATSKAADKIDDAVEKMADNSQENISAFQQAMATMAGFIGGQAVIGAFHAVKDAAVGFFKSLVTDGVKAAQVQEDAVNDLNFALARTGKFSRETSEEMQAFASSLQNTTRFGDEVILKNMALIQSLGGLEKDGLKAATQAAANLSAALGIELSAASNLVAKAAAGNVSPFSRYGVVIEAGANKAETFANALEALNSKFGGAAAASVKTYSGVVQQAQNSFGDFTEQVGFLITQNSSVIAMIEEVKNIFNEMGSAVGENKDGLQSFVTQGLLFVVDAVPVMVAGVATIVMSLRDMQKWVLKARGAWNELVGDADKAQELADSLYELENGSRRLEESFSSAIDKANDMASRIRQAAEEGAEGQEALNEMLEKQSAAAAMATEQTKQLTEAEIARNEQARTFAETLMKNAEATESIYAQELEMLALQLEEKTLLEDEFWAAREEALLQKQERESQILEDARARDQITEADYHKAKTQLARQQDVEARKLALEKQKFDQNMDKERMDAMKQFNDGVMILTRSGNKNVAGAAKALASFQATTSGIVAVQNALANVPYPANLAAAAGMAVQTAANVARINGVALNKGGTVPGSGPNRDSVAAMLTPGEEVVNRSTAEMLREFLEGQREGGSLRIELSMRDEIMEFIEAKIIERQRIGVSLLNTRLA